MWISTIAAVAAELLEHVHVFHDDSMIPHYLTLIVGLFIAMTGSLPLLVCLVVIWSIFNVQLLKLRRELQADGRRTHPLRHLLTQEHEIDHDAEAEAGVTEDEEDVEVENEKDVVHPHSNAPVHVQEGHARAEQESPQENTHETPEGGPEEGKNLPESPEHRRRTAQIHMLRQFNYNHGSVQTGPLSVSTTSMSSREPMSASHTDNDAIEKIDALCHYMLQGDTVDQRYLHTQHGFYATGTYSLPNDDVSVTISEIVINSSGLIDRIRMTLFSETRSISELFQWLESIQRVYLTAQDNALCDQLYYFRHIITEIPQHNSQNSLAGGMGVNHAHAHSHMHTLSHHHGHSGHAAHDGFSRSRETPMTAPEKYDWSKARRDMLFTMTRFNASKKFEHLVGPHVRQIESLINIFELQPDFFRARGMPHTIGFVLTGGFGVGKTSVVKAVAMKMNRHLVEFKLSPHLTKSQVESLFTDDYLSVLSDDHTSSNTSSSSSSSYAYGHTQQTHERRYYVPQSKRVYVSDEADWSENLLCNRDYSPPEWLATASQTEAATPSFWAQVLDGFIERNSNVLFIIMKDKSSVEKMDRAFLRPGRLDHVIDFPNCSIDMIAEILIKAYGVPDDVKSLFARLSSDELLSMDSLFSPAEIESIVRRADPVLGLGQLSYAWSELRSLTLQRTRSGQHEQPQMTGDVDAFTGITDHNKITDDDSIESQPDTKEDVDGVSTTSRRLNIDEALDLIDQQQPQVVHSDNDDSIKPLPRSMSFGLAENSTFFSPAPVFPVSNSASTTTRRNRTKRAYMSALNESSGHYA